MIRLVALAVAAAPFLWFAARDFRYHLGSRKPGRAEDLIHLALGMAQVGLLVSAARASLRGEIAAASVIAVFGAADEFVFHRALPAAESDLHAKSHFALFVFVAAALAIDQPWTAP